LSYIVTSLELTADDLVSQFKTKLGVKKERRKNYALKICKFGVLLIKEL